MSIIPFRFESTAVTTEVELSTDETEKLVYTNVLTVASGLTDVLLLPRSVTKANKTYNT